MNTFGQQQDFQQQATQQGLQSPQQGFQQTAPRPSEPVDELEEKARQYEDNFMIGTFSVSQSASSPGSLAYTKDSKKNEAWNVTKINRAIQEGNFISRYHNANGNRAGAPQSVAGIKKKLEVRPLVYLPYVPRALYQPSRLEEVFRSMGDVWNNYPTLRSRILSGRENQSWENVKAELVYIISNGMRSMSSGKPDLYDAYINSSGNTNIRLVGDYPNTATLDDIVRLADDPHRNLLISTLIYSGVAGGTSPVTTFVKIWMSLYIIYEFGIYQANINNPRITALIEGMKTDFKTVKKGVHTDMPVLLYVTLSRYINSSVASRPKNKFYEKTSGIAVENYEDIITVKKRRDFVEAVVKNAKLSQLFPDIPDDFERIDISDFPHGNFTVKKGSLHTLANNYVILGPFNAHVVHPTGEMETVYIPRGLLIVRPYHTKSAGVNKQMVAGGPPAVVTALLALDTLNKQDLDEYRKEASRYVNEFSIVERGGKDRNVRYADVSVNASSGLF